MVIEKQYQQLVGRLLGQIKSGFDTSVIGMYDCGKNYTYDLIPKLIPGVQGMSLLHLGSLGSTREDWWRRLTEELGSDEVGVGLRRLLRKGKVCLLINQGYMVLIPEDFLTLWKELKEEFGQRFSVVFFANTHILNDQYENQDLYIDLVLKAERLTILPLDRQDTDITLRMYEARYGSKVRKDLRERISSDSGGNPGILKSLYMQYLDDNYIENWNVSDSRLVYRLDRLTRELSDMENRVLVGQSQDDESRLFLKKYGYLTEDGECFAPVLKHYLEIGSQKGAGLLLDDCLSKLLTVSEKKIYLRLGNNLSKILTREQIAEEIWGSDWFTKFSDWALDQLMSQLRRKLASKQGYGELITKRGEGYYLEK
ncbi:hypothetical protein AUJ42_01515 [Candidatus Collierbacteria bacterium CG1_02_44_10]|uniref:OmpR/PhoB-type domain-containing protein n=1 Tax=Candidatus Collierbacteria bacterium CG1_02_44_10 TaxID=1805087 RepID=A0A1J4RZ11_9BACT|nr:MAG: hypothetical protein AUJ42_01515 [Candidatus Collierbacteria bacterium CG1_02_44_10]